VTANILNGMFKVIRGHVSPVFCKEAVRKPYKTYLVTIED